MLRHFHGVIVLHPRFEGDRSNNHYPKYSLILRVFHYPTSEGKGRPQTPYPTYSLILRVFHYPTPEGIGERPQTPYPTHSLSLRVFHYSTPEGKRRDHSLPILHTASERPRTPYPKCSLIIWVFHYPTPEVRRRDPGHPLSLVQPHLSLHPRGEKERPQSAYPKYSLILMVDHYPTQEQKKTDPGFLILECTCFWSLTKKVLVFWGTYCLFRQSRFLIPVRAIIVDYQKNR